MFRTHLSLEQPKSSQESPDSKTITSELNRTFQVNKHRGQQVIDASSKFISSTTELNTDDKNCLQIQELLKFSLATITTTAEKNK